jgi:DNA-binding NarL/FixJ family response regulator
MIRRKRRRNPRILVADDHEFVRRGVKGILRSRGNWKVIGEAANGRDAVEKASKLKPDIVIVDISMPDLDGLQATRQIRQENPSIQVVVLTMHESDQMVRLVLEAGAQGYVLKSDIASHLVKAVREVLAGRLFLTPEVSNILFKTTLTAADKPEPIEVDQVGPSPRQREIIRLLAEGLRNKEIAAELGLSIRTVEMHRGIIMRKFSLSSFAQLVQYAIRQNIFSVPSGQNNSGCQVQPKRECLPESSPDGNGS